MGVKRAINIAEDTAQSEASDNVTILKEIVHNNSVVQKFRDSGVKQEFEVDGIDSGTVVISAHGVDPSVINEAKDKGLNVIDATCPLVTRIHEIVDKLMARDYYVIHFGDEHHDETLGVIGHAKPGSISVVATVEELKALPQDLVGDSDKIALTSQATSEVAAFEEAEKIATERWPSIKIFNTVCNATTQRQSAIVKLADQVDMILVVGSKTSANSQRLTDIAEALCGEAHLIENADVLDSSWLEHSAQRKIYNVGISAGASTPDFLVEGVIERLGQLTSGDAQVIRSNQRKTENELTLLQETKA